jgi:hypothetical protein
MDPAHHASHFECTQPLMAPAACRRLLAEERARGWPTLAASLTRAYGRAWRAHADSAADALLAHGRRQHGHDGTELVLVEERPWRTLVATFDDDRLLGLVSEQAGTVAARAASNGLIGGSVAPPGLWGTPVRSLVGPLGVSLHSDRHWVVVDHTGQRLLATSSVAVPDDDIDDSLEDDGPSYVLVRQAVAPGQIAPVGWRCAGLAWELGRRHPLVSVAPPSDPVVGVVSRSQRGVTANVA